MDSAATRIHVAYACVYVPRIPMHVAYTCIHVVYICIHAPRIPIRIHVASARVHAFVFRLLFAFVTAAFTFAVGVPVPTGTHPFIE